MQFRFTACLFIDPAVHMLHAVSLQPMDSLPVYHHTKVTFSVAPGSAIWVSREASWKVFTNEVSYYTPSSLTFRGLEAFLCLLSWLVFLGSHWRTALILKILDKCVQRGKKAAILSQGVILHILNIHLNIDRRMTKFLGPLRALTDLALSPLSSQWPSTVRLSNSSL